MARRTESAAGHSDRVHPTLVGRKLGRYEVLTQLASGGMATVYVARAQGVAGFERLVAVKVLHPHMAHEDEFISMFLDEARLAARIHHPNVVATLDISDTESSGYFLVMEYIEGDHFGALLQRATEHRDRLPVPVVIRIVLDALGGLGAAHRLTDESGQPLRIVHRDVSPHNVLVGIDGLARLTDFGVAKAEVRLSSTREGQFKGKLSYMAPEQANDGYADQRSDLFSMATLLWEGLACRRLFRGENNAETLKRILEVEIDPPSKLRPEAAPFDAVLATALRRNPDQRYPSADEFAVALEAAAKDTTGIATVREVAEAVQRHTAEKLEGERQRIRQAIGMLGRSELGACAVRPMGAPVRTSSSESVTLPARPSTMRPSVARSRTRRRNALAGVLFFALLTAGWIAFLDLGAETTGLPAWTPAPTSRSPELSAPPGAGPQVEEAPPIPEAALDGGADRPAAPEAQDSLAPVRRGRPRGPGATGRDPAFRNPYRQ